MNNLAKTDWYRPLLTTLGEPYFEKITTYLQEVYSYQTVYPARENVFAAFQATSLHEVKVVILGQDPYPNAGQAQGLSFSVPADMPLPKSLVNIYRELKNDLGVDAPADGDLHRWAKQGVLLLNTVLTVPHKNAGGHSGKIWEPFTDAVIQLVAEQPQPVVFILWGKQAQTKSVLINGSQNLVLTAPHPSPLSAYRGFFGSRPFSKTNAFLVENGVERIAWSN